jgi:hypothetical protein
MMGYTARPKGYAVLCKKRKAKTTNKKEKVMKAKDFTALEPKLPALKKNYYKLTKKLLLEEFKNGDSTWSSIKDINSSFAYRDDDCKVQLKTDIVVGKKVYARKGDILWAVTRPKQNRKRLPFGLVHYSPSSKAYAKQLENYNKAHYVVRAVSPRKKASRPSWDGELYSTQIWVNLVDAKKISN